MSDSERRDDGRDEDLLRIGEHVFRSRLFVGTGKYKDVDETRRALEASGAEVITVALRRVDLAIGVGYGSELRDVQRVMQAVADRNPLSLDEPKPLIILLGFGDSAVNFQLSLWGKTENFLELKTSIQLELKAAFDEAGIEIPFPQRTLSAGGGALPVRMVDGGGPPGQGREEGR